MGGFVLVLNLLEFLEFFLEILGCPRCPFDGTVTACQPIEPPT